MTPTPTTPTSRQHGELVLRHSPGSDGGGGCAGLFLVCFLLMWGTLAVGMARAVFKEPHLYDIAVLFLVTAVWLGIAGYALFSSSAQDELRVDASAGGGVVTVQMKGNHELIALKVDPEAVKEGDVEMLQDMVVAAVNEANRKVDEAMKGKLGGMLPPGLGGLFG